jgi:hypothetical protein
LPVLARFLGWPCSFPPTTVLTLRVPTCGIFHCRFSGSRISMRYPRQSVRGLLRRCGVIRSATLRSSTLTKGMACRRCRGKSAEIVFEERRGAQGRRLRKEKFLSPGINAVKVTVRMTRWQDSFGKEIDFLLSTQLNAVNLRVEMTRGQDFRFGGRSIFSLECPGMSRFVNWIACIGLELEVLWIEMEHG